MRAMTWACALGVLVVLGGARPAHAYPQLQLRAGETCGDCHVAVAGGGPLNDMGLFTAGDIAWKEGDPSFLHGALGLPTGLTLTGDVRFAAGVKKAGEVGPAVFPMQAEVMGAYERGNFAVIATVGAMAPAEDEPLNALTSRDHYVQWRERAGEAFGFSARVGRFAPVFGLRLAEHPFYVRQYVTPLFAESYGASVAYVGSRGEAHLSTFMNDPWRYSSERGDGFVGYGEWRLRPTLQLGAGARWINRGVEATTTGAVTAKWAASDRLTVMGEVDVLHQDLGAETRQMLAATVMATWALPKGVWLDVGVGHWNPELAISELDRAAVDVNLHWFLHSHLELVLMNRVQMLSFGAGGPATGWSALQVHYRL